MLNDKNASIRYLMKELDPSDELLIERAMMDDEDLLIEVECMRRTLQRLNNNLPTVDPPAHLTKKIIRQASKRRPAANSVYKAFQSERIRYMAAAASLLLVMVVGLAWFQYDSINPTATAASNANVNAASVTSSSYVISPVSINGVEPWVDRNDVLRFQDQFNNQNNQVAFDSILNYSTRKLKPIDDPLQVNNRSRVLQLTGSD